MPIPAVARANDLVGNLILKVPLPQGDHIHDVRCDACRAVGYWETPQAGLLALKLGPSQRGTVEIRFGPALMPLVVLGDGTYDVIDLERDGRTARLTVRVYGRQTVRLRLPFKPVEAKSLNPNAAIHGVEYDPGAGIASLRVEGRDIHGEEVAIEMKQG
jgi:hypothetical protein